MNLDRSLWSSSELRHSLWRRSAAVCLRAGGLGTCAGAQVGDPGGELIEDGGHASGRMTGHHNGLL